MDREELSGISKEFEQVLEQVAAGLVPLEGKEDSKEKKKTEPEPRAVKAWRQPVEEDSPGAGGRDADTQNADRREVDRREADKREVDRREADRREADRREGNRRNADRRNADRGGSDDISTNSRRTGRRNTRISTAGLLHPSDGLIAAFFIPVIILIVIFAQRGIYPFGQESFLRTDMYHQYAPFFSEFQNKLTGGGSLLYSWDIGMGVNFAALYAYYLASPLNWLLILCPKAFIIEFMTYSVVFKTGLCGLTFAYYLRKHNGRVDFGAAFFGVFYALSGYMAAYSWNIMWLDCILLFPLIMLGLERLVKEKKGMLYCITLGISILSNYYISIMICVFMVMYLVCLLILERKGCFRDFLISLLQFGAYSLIAGALAAMVLIPEIYALQSTASGDINFPKTFEMYFSIFDMLARHIGNVQTETGLDHWPNIYCGVAVFMFFLLYLACRKIPVKEKVITCSLLLLFFASFSLNVLNFMWHGFHYPNSLPCRQSFLYIFLMLSLCYRAYMYLDETPKKHIAFSFWGAVCFVLLAQKLVTDKAFHFSVFYAAILFLALYTGLIYLYQNPRRSRMAVALLALGVVAVEAAVNMTVTSISTTSRTSYKADNQDVAGLTADLTSENGFYRVEKVDGKTKNDGAWMNFPTVSLFSSLAHADMTAFFKKVGCEGSTNAYSITGSTPVVDALLSVKYALYKSAQDNPRLILNRSLGDTYLYENPYTLPLGFLLPEGMEPDWQTDMPNPVDVQNDLSDVLDIPYLFTELDGEGTGTSFSFMPEKDGEYYVYILNKKVKSVSVAKGEATKTYDNTNRGYLVEVGFCQAGEVVTLTNKEDSEELNARAYLFEQEGLKAMYEKLNSSPLLLIKWEDDALEGSIEAAADGTVFLSMPYDKGWSVWVDDEPVTAGKVFDAFIGVDVTAGRHIITMKYMPQGLKEGALISLAAVGVLLLIALMGYYLNKKRIHFEPSPYDKLDEEWKGMKKREGNE